MRKKSQGQKGSFGEQHLPVSKNYLVPHSRKQMAQIGGVAILVVLVVAVFNFWGQGASMASRGQISSAHAKFSGDCQACHTQFGAVTNEKCSVCHEKYGNKLGVYTFSTHYLYHAQDTKRLTASKKYAQDETLCSACHKEHGGRTAKMTNVSDQYCLTCHAFKSFNKNHPQFGFVALKQEDPGLHFTHIRHVEEVVKLKKLVDIEKACLYCHNAQSDGKNFEPINFDRHCDACHLTTTTKTPNLQIRRTDAPGVETLEMLQHRNAPGTLWAFYTNPNEFRISGGAVLKSPVYHNDPWIMENLRSLRKTLYADAGLADLLSTSARGGTATASGENNTRVLYNEAIQTLKDRALSLRSTPQREIQSALQEVDNLLHQVSQKVQDPTTILDKEKFMTPLRQKSMGAEQADEIKRIVNNLTKPCVDCHIIEDATIKRVVKDQRVLTRAHFDHRAHILQRRCLDCHTEIPFRKAEKGETIIDKAEIQNIPKIEVCKECHNPKLTSNQCVTCHYFHPNKTNRSDMLLYRE